MKDYIGAIFMLITILIFMPLNVYAYLDLGTGSYVIQIVLAMVLGGLYTLKILWEKIKIFFKKFF